MPGAYATHSLDEVVEACKRTRNAEAWDEFLLRTHKTVAATVASTMRRWGWYDLGRLDDVIQDVYLKISENEAALLRNFETRHPNAILGYLRAMSVSVASDHFRAAMAAKRGAGRETSLGEIDPVASGPHSGGEESIERAILLRQIDEIFQRNGISSRDRTIFWLQYRQGLTASSIASIPAIALTTKGVESTVRRLIGMLREKLGAGRINEMSAKTSAGKDIDKRTAL